MRSKEQIKADNLAILPSLIEMGATYGAGIEAWVRAWATSADGLAYLRFPVIQTTRTATAEEVAIAKCENYEECPCCACGADIVSVIVESTYRWSKSGKCLVPEISEWGYCSTHA